MDPHDPHGPDEVHAPGDPSDHQHVRGFGGSPECTLCPACVLLQALGTSRPDVTQHLMGAARELALALKSLVEGHVEGLDRAQAATSQRLQRLRID